VAGLGGANERGVLEFAEGVEQVGIVSELPLGFFMVGVEAGRDKRTDGGDPVVDAAAAEQSQTSVLPAAAASR
jgi:hypothetical protein